MKGITIIGVQSSIYCRMQRKIWLFLHELLVFLQCRSSLSLDAFHEIRILIGLIVDQRKGPTIAFRDGSFRLRPSLPS